MELEEGVRLLGLLRGVAAGLDGLAVGMPLEVVFEDVDAQVTLPAFRPALSR
jgi:hypothetical protein